VASQAGKDIEFMKLALKEARKAFTQAEVPVGAVIVYDNQVIAVAHNERESQQSPLAHAEILAIEQAAKYFRRWRLTGCTIYVTKEPCPMCAGAIFQARFDRLVYGATDPKSGAAGSLFNIVQDRRLYHQVEVTTGVLKEEASELLQQFFKEKRQKDSI
jgi:tRNA(adenine34) deaminase